MPGFSQFRALLILGGIGTGLVGMIGRVAYLQTIGRQRYIHWVERQQHQQEKILARRGTVWSSDGSAMALTIQTVNLFADPRFLHEAYASDGRGIGRMEADLRRLALLIDRDPAWLIRLIREQKDRQYVRIAEDLGEGTCQEIRDLGIPGVGLEPVGTRYYPMGSLACHVLGTVGSDGRGLEGLELRFEKMLAGRDGWQRVQKDARRRPLGVDAGDYVPPQHGQHLVLTIDSQIQMIAEQELAAVCVEHGARRGEVVVMDPRNGQILAMANWPAFNPQNLEDSTLELRRNRCLTDPYEPGSTLKPFIMGPALAAGVTRANEVWPVRNPYVLPYGRIVRDVHHYGPLATWDVLVKSSNVGMCMLAGRMGNSRLYDALRGFRFGQPTGIELPGEDSGVVYPLPKWSRASTESVAQGYEVMVTPLQLARAFCVYCNGGYLVRPRIVKGVLDEKGKLLAWPAEDTLPGAVRVMEPEWANLLRQMLADVVVRGTGTLARSSRWNVFGKTGTAHISAGRSGYHADKINASFLCGAPLEDPRIVVAFVVHEPDRSKGRYGGSVSAPGAKRLVERVLAYLQVPESPPLAPPPPSIASVLHNFNLARYGAQAASARNDPAVLD